MGLGRGPEAPVSTSTKQPAIVMLSKRPVPGSSKTRLLPGLTPLQAADLQAAFLRDLSRMLLAQDAAVPYIACTPPGPASARYFGGLLGDHRVFPQNEGDLGSRMAGAIAHLLAQGHGPVLVIGSDCPALQPACIAEALVQLAEADLVVGPARDGGYWLLGMHEVHAPLFEDMPWSSPVVLATTRERAIRLGLEMRWLHEDFDVDTVQDLLRLVRLLEAPPAHWTELPVHTMAAIARLREEVPWPDPSTI